MSNLLKWLKDALSKRNKQKRMRQEPKKEYSEKDYWEGNIPDELFEEYLQKYGYEYTPTV
jgi:hypothetical protein